MTSRSFPDHEKLLAVLETLKSIEYLHFETCAQLRYATQQRTRTPQSKKSVFVLQCFFYVSRGRYSCAHASFDRVVRGHFSCTHLK